jgi:hypothetical protein
VYLCSYVQGEEKKTPTKVLTNSKASGYPVLFAISVCDNLSCLKVISTMKLETSINFRNSPPPKTTNEHTILYCLFLAYHTLIPNNVKYHFSTFYTSPQDNMRCNNLTLNFFFNSSCCGTLY